MRELFLVLLCIFAVCCDARKPKVYKVNLDEAPEERWKEVIEDHKQQLPSIRRELGEYFKTPFRGVMCWLLEKIVYSFPEEYAKEMEGIAKYSGLEYCEVIGLNILYDITNYNKLIDMAKGPCSSILAEDDGGRIFHGRNLDYFMADLIKDLSIIVDFTRKDKVVYTGVTMAYFNGLVTGQKPNAFTLSLNARSEIFALWHFARVFEKAETYDEAIEDLQHINLISPCYLILGGVKSGEGALITRDRFAAADVMRLQVKKDRWFIVQTNFDHWDPDEDSRRTTAEIFLREIKHENLDEDTMLSVLDHKPVRNKWGF